MCAEDIRSCTVAYLSTMFSLLQENSIRSTWPLAYPVPNPLPSPSTGPRRRLVPLAYPVPNHWPPPSTRPRRSTVYTPGLSCPQPLAPS